MKDESFIHHLHQPDTADGSALVLLHGTGGNEQDLMPLAARVAPNATLLGVRGRSNEEGIARWFRRLAMARFDQKHIRNEADAFTSFMKTATARHSLDPARMTFLGYSNGANFIAALLALHHKLVPRAILLRPMQPLEAPPRVDLSACHVLMLAGTTDPYGKYAPALENWLRRCNAHVDARLINAGHQLASADPVVAAQWLATQSGAAAPGQRMPSGLPST